MNSENLAFTKSDIIEPKERLRLMREHAGEDGTLYIPEWYKDVGYCEDNYIKLKMDRNGDYDALAKEFDRLCTDLKDIARFYDELGDTKEENAEVLYEDLLPVWEIYLKDFDADGFDMMRIDEITEKFDSIEFAQRLKDEIEAGTATEDEIRMYNDYKDLRITQIEDSYYSSYIDTITREAKERVGNGFAAASLINSARRYCYLIALNAPEIIVDNEASMLAQKLAVHRFALSMETLKEDDVL